MALRFVLGSAGSGKSRYMYSEVTREAQRHPDDRYFVIVPEQFNMQTQRDLVRYSPNGGILNIDIVSFPKLAEYIFAETGTDPGRVLTDTGKNLVIRQAAVRVRNQLGRLGSRLDRPGCIPQIKSLLSEFAQYTVTSEDIEMMISLAEGKPALQEKLQDILTISRSFDELRRERFITSEELLKVLAQQIPYSGMLKGAHLYFNGFTGFTPVQMLVMQELMKTAAHVTVALTMDPEKGLPSAERTHDLFYLTGKTVRALRMTAALNAVEIEDSILLEGQKRFRRDSGLAKLERRLLRYAVPAAQEEKAPEDIHIIEASDPLGEAYFAAERIWQMTHEEGYRYSEIAVICGDLPDYQDQVTRVFEEYRIPCFVDRKNSVGINPCLEMIRAAMQIVEENWSYASVFHFLRIGYSDLSMQQIDLLENYVLAFGIRGSKKWRDTWTRRDRDVTDEQLEELNTMRETLVRQLTPFLKAFQAAQGRVNEYTEAVRILLKQVNVQEHLTAVSEELENSEEMESASEENGQFRESAGTLPTGLRHTMAMEYDQIWQIIQNVLDEADELMGEENVSRGEFTHILETGFDEARVGVIPPGIDEVCIGDIIRTRLKHIKVVFLLGACDGVIPVRDSGGGLLSQMERQFLADREVELAPDARQEGFIQRFYLYQTLTKPSDALYISYAQSSSGGDSLRPSYLIYHLMKILPGLRVQNAETAAALYQNKDRHKLRTPRQGYLALAEGLRQAVSSGESKAETLELIRQYLHSSEYGEKTERLLQAATETGEADNLGPDLAHRLYGTPLILSVSGLENFGNCPFMYFVSYGLRLHDRKMLQVAASDTGTFMHEAMYRFVSSMSGDDWHSAEKAELALRLEKAVQDTAILESEGRNLFGDTAANRYMLTRMRRALLRSALVLASQMGAGMLLPAALEQRFSHPVQTADGGRMVIKGTIDRIDQYLTDSDLYMRVVDYKSSARGIDLSQYLAGIQLQLPLYLTEAAAMLGEKYPGRQIIPAAALYSQIADPIIKPGDRDAGIDGDEEALLRAFMQKLKPDGLVNSDPEVLQLLDHELRPGGTSLIMPVALKTDGTLKGSIGVRKTATAAELKALNSCTQRIVQHMAEEILDGRIEISPVMKSRTDTACTWCAYQDVCGRDPRLKAFRYRQIPGIDKNTVWDRIVQIAEEGES